MCCSVVLPEIVMHNAYISILTQYTNQIMEFVWFLNIQPFYNTKIWHLQPVNRTLGIDHHWLVGGERDISRCSFMETFNYFTTTNTIRTFWQFYYHFQFFVQLAYFPDESRLVQGSPDLLKEIHWIFLENDFYRPDVLPVGCCLTNGIRAHEYYQFILKIKS